MVRVGRKRTVNLHLPPQMRLRKGRYYFDTQATPRREIPLGGEFATALVKWAELQGRSLAQSSIAPTFGMAADRYEREVLPTKAPRTQRDNRVELKKLRAVFRDFALEQIKPVHVRGYLDARGKKARVRANREKALLSHIFNMARAWGYTDAPNPCAGIKGFREDGRDKYVEDAEFQAVKDAADGPTRDAMDIAYLTGQRPADVLKMTIRDLQDGCLRVRQGKTGTKLRIAIEGELAALLERLQAQTFSRVASMYLIRNERGQPLTYGALRQRFEKARTAAILALKESGQRELAGAVLGFQFRDLRAKAASDLGDIAAARRLLAHGSVTMTEHYTRTRMGDRVKPVK